MYLTIIDDPFNMDVLTLYMYQFIVVHCGIIVVHFTSLWLIVVKRRVHNKLACGVFDIRKPFLNY